MAEMMEAANSHSISSQVLLDIEAPSTPLVTESGFEGFGVLMVLILAAAVFWGWRRHRDHRRLRTRLRVLRASDVNEQNLWLAYDVWQRLNRSGRSDALRLNPQWSALGENLALAASSATSMVSRETFLSCLDELDRALSSKRYSLLCVIRRFFAKDSLL
ncbi:hypothetical protein [Thiomicrorhabdus sp.]|uniref:hypothetical protein n=1 Tax=Thiomicrorhabdus sp. TaxID=2039724 RepID=UPI0029C6F09E|nr:hypothetical protein [Thiomicrorhabdus sp.]